MATLLEFGGKPDFHEVDGSLMIDGAGAKAKDVGVVVSTAHAGRKFVENKRSPHGREFVGGNAHANARSTN